MASRGHAGGLAATSTAAADGVRCRRLRHRAARDGRHGPERGRGGRRGRHDGGARGARDGRRGPGDQGRSAGGRGPGGRQQGRPARRPADGGPAAGDARADGGPRRDGDSPTAPPKRPEVLVTTASTGEGRPGAARGPRSPPGTGVDGATRPAAAGPCRRPGACRAGGAPLGAAPRRPAWRRRPTRRSTRSPDTTWIPTRRPTACWPPCARQEERHEHRAGLRRRAPG